MERSYPNRLQEIKRVFSEVLEAEVKKYYFKKVKPSKKYKHENTHITLWNNDGDAFFCDKYILLGNGNGTNNALIRALGERHPNCYSNMLIYGDNTHVFWLNLPHPDGIKKGVNRQNRSLLLKTLILKQEMKKDLRAYPSWKAENFGDFFLRLLKMLLRKNYLIFNVFYNKGHEQASSLGFLMRTFIFIIVLTKLKSTVILHLYFFHPP